MQPIRVTYNQACELLSIKRDALRLLVQQDTTFPRPIKYGSKRQSPVYFDYLAIIEWHKSKMQNLTQDSNEVDA